MAGRKLIVEVAADISQYVKSLRNGAHAADVFAKEVTVDTRAVAEAQVKAAIKSTQALEKQAVAYRAVAASAEKGSKEQVVAARLAAEADARLARSIGTVGREAAAAHGKTRNLERDLSHATRGALSGAGAMHGFGRSLAFASGGFIAFHSAADFLRESVDAAREAIVSQRSLAAQMKASGESFSANREEIEKTALSFGKFGFQNDEVIAGLTVLERGTGNVKKSLGLLTLTGDIARARTISFAASAGIVAKVFGGQETALRRAVPGLSKHAHGLTLIGLASAKMRGQMAANTTAAERFHSTLHDTQEIVGTALLPTLNKYLDQLSRWLERMNRSGKLQRDVARTSQLLADAIGAIKTVLDPLVVAFQALAKAVGGNKRAFELLLGVFVAFKALKIAGGLLETMAALRKTAVEGRGLLRVVARLRVGLIRLVTNPYVIAIVLTYVGAKAVADKIKELQESAIKAQQATFKKGSGLETTLVPALAKQIAAMKKSGESGAQIITELRKKLGGSLKADDLIGEAFAFSSGADPAMQARVRAQVAKRAKEATAAAKDELDKQAKAATVEQRNTWFDQLISRLMGGVEDTPTGAPAALGVQLARLRKVAATLVKQIAATNDATRLLHLKGQLQEVLNQEWQKQQEINQKTADAAAAAQEKAQKAYDSMIAALEVNVAKAGLTKTLTDNVAAQKALVAALRERVRATHGSSEAWQNLISAQGELNDLQEQAAQQAEEARAARQFRALGLGPGGEDLIPGIGNLRKRLQAIRTSISGTSLDTRAIQQTIRRIGTVLSGAFGAVGDQVRSKIDEIFKGWADELKTGRDTLATKFRPVDANKFIAGLGLGLTPDQVKRLRAGIVTLGPNATAPTHHTGAFALAGGVTINGGMHLHGVQDMSRFEAELQKRAHGRPHPRRGAR